MHPTAPITHLHSSTYTACAQYADQIGADLVAAVAAPRHGQAAACVLHYGGRFTVLVLCSDNGHVAERGGKQCESLIAALQYAAELAC